jgi:hypothetical protein
MAALQQKVPSSTGLLLIAGSIMVATLWTSKKARGVTATEVNLGRQAEGSERFDSTILARTIVRMALALHAGAVKITPPCVRKTLAARFSQNVVAPAPSSSDGKKPSFDMLRASVNLMVASALVSFATSMKLPLSTTYVTFMVAMGTSLADQAWGRESAVYRITGVLTVIGGWFFTAFIAFTISLALAAFIYFVHFPAVVILMIIGGYLIYRNFAVHNRREEAVKAMAAFSLKTITSEREAIHTSLKHAGQFLFAIRANLSDCFDGIISESRATLKEARVKTKMMQQWTNVIIANTYKTLFLLQKKRFEHAHQYIRTIRSLQEIVESHRDLVIRAFQHVDNHHTGLTPRQKEELAIIKTALGELLNTAALMLQNQHFTDMLTLCNRQGTLMELVAKFDANQTVRIGNGQSKTRLSILFYGFLDACVKISDHTLLIMTLFRDCFEMDRIREG